MLKFLLSLVLLLNFWEVTHADEGDLMINEVIQLLKNENINSAVSFIEAQGDESLVPELYSKLVQNLYWKDLNAVNLLAIGNAGIKYCLKKAELTSDSVKKDELKSWAKTLAFDMAANSWPYWGDPGVVISREEMAEGMKAAKLNLELAIELNKPKDKLALAYWLIGIHYLAISDKAESLSYLNRYKEISIEIHDQLSIVLAEGYIGIVDITIGNKIDGEARFQKAINDFAQINNDDARFYSQQLKTVLKLSQK
jgi:tetratricopeptide (TPR) repeat protein